MELENERSEIDMSFIPRDWKIKSLSELGKFSKGQGIRKDESLSGIIPCVRYGELYTKHHDFIKTFYSFISEEISLSSKRLKTGDILFAGSGETKEEIGKCAAFIDNIEAYAGGDIVILSPANVNSLFLGYILNSPFVQRQKARKGQGDAVVHISAAQLANIIIPFPPNLKEQSAIAVALSDTDALIDGLEKLIAKKRRIKEGIMQAFFQRQIGVKVKKLGEFCKGISSGRSETKSNAGKYPIYGSTGIIGWRDSFDYQGTKILVARVGANAGAANIVKGKYCVSDNTLMISYDEKYVNTYYLYYNLISLKLNSLIFGSGQPLITGALLKTMEVLYPPITEQNEIATILLDIDSELESLESKLSKYRQIKSGMMQTLLTGQIRLV